MKIKHLPILIVFLLFGCSSKRLFNVEKVNLVSINQVNRSETVFFHDDSLNLNITYSGFVQDQLEFDLSIENLSKDTIQIDPSRFKYWSVRSRNDLKYVPNKQYTKCSNSDTTLLFLRVNRENLLKLENPYTPGKYKTKDEIQEAIVKGAIFSILDLDDSDTEYESRAEKELKWDHSKKNLLRYYNEHIDFLENKALLISALPPNEKVSGKIRFAIDLKAKQIQLLFPIDNHKIITTSFDQIIVWN